MYFRQHQRSLTLLADTITKLAASAKKTKKVTDLQSVVLALFYDGIWKNTADLLEFLKSDFKKYFDRDFKAPIRYSSEYIRSIKIKKQKLKDLLATAGVNAELTEIVLLPLEICIHSESVCTYHQIEYLTEFYSQLESFFNNSHEEIHDEICNQLFHLNFNCTKFIKYYVGYMKSQAGKCNHEIELIEFYYLKFKLINQIPTQREFIYNNKRESILNQISTWITEELYYLEKKRNLLPINVEEKKNEVNDDTKIQTSLSVADLSLALKLLMEAKVITNRNAREVTKLVARNFKTNKRESISEESLYNKTYNVERSTVDRMKDVIFTMMNLMKGY